jgi:hypothetical protein
MSSSYPTTSPRPSPSYRRAAWVSPGFAEALALVVALSIPLVALAQGSAFPRTAALRSALCHGRRACRVESVLRAGADRRGSPLAVVRLSFAPRNPEDDSCHAYSDRLVAVRRGRLIDLRELARGDALCLEWHPSTWTYENGELVFEHGGMGAPPPAGTDVRPVRTHLRPWPLAILRELVGDEVITPTPVITERGPLFVLSQDNDATH